MRSRRKRRRRPTGHWRGSGIENLSFKLYRSGFYISVSGLNLVFPECVGAMGNSEVGKFGPGAGACGFADLVSNFKMLAGFSELVSLLRCSPYIHFQDNAHNLYKRPCPAGWRAVTAFFSKTTARNRLQFGCLGYLKPGLTCSRQSP